MSWRCCSEVVRHDSNAFVAMSGSSSTSSGEMPLRVRMGSSVVGEMVVITSTDMMSEAVEYLQHSGVDAE